MKWTVGVKIGAGFSLMSAILLFVGLASYHSTNKLTDTDEWVIHSYQVLEKLDGLSEALINAETGERGFIITADATYLQPYAAGSASCEKFVKELRDLTRDNPRHQQRLDVLEPQTKQRLATLKEMIYRLPREWKPRGSL